jgi:hypothetical protein
MRWGLLAGLAVAANGLAILLPGCDTPPNDAPLRYYIPPDAGGDTPGTPNPIFIDGGGAATDAPADAVPSGDAGLALALTGWWRGPFAAAPWAGTASGGASGTASLAAGTAAPAPGTALNGFAPAEFNGTTEYLTGPLASTFFTVTTFSGWALVNVAAISTNSADWGLNKTIVSTAGTEEFGIFLRDDGVSTVTVGIAVFSGAAHSVSTSIAKNAWQLVQWRSNGVTMSIRVNGGAWASTDSGSISALAYALEVGRSPGATQFFNGRIAEVGTAATALSDADFDSVRAYATGRYGTPF